MLFYLLSNPWVGYGLTRWTEAPYQPLPETTDAGAIVVLGGGKAPLQPEYGRQSRPSASSYSRLAYALRLQRQYGLPILVTGGAARFAWDSEAAAMGAALKEFGAGEVWLETRSRNTWENAFYGAEVLREHKVTKVLLVTDSQHMRRGLYVFEKQGLEVVPAPTSFARADRRWYGIMGVLPQSEALEDSTKALKRKLGEIYYRLRFR